MERPNESNSLEEAPANDSAAPAELPVIDVGAVIARAEQAAKELEPSHRDAILALAADSEANADKLEALADRLAQSGLGELSELTTIAAATLDLADPTLKTIWGGPFNGQALRQSIMNDLIVGLDVAAVIETGTFRGSTTEFLARRFPIPIFSCETNARLYHYSKMRLARWPNVRLGHCDSREFLKQLLESSDLPNGLALFYLDAHWSADLPLWQEIDTIFTLRPSAVVVVDDFRVPGDRGFSYDDYGRGKCLSAIDLRANVGAEFEMLFPRRSSGAETGSKRGMVVLAGSETAERTLNAVPDLERLDWRQAVLTDAVGELTGIGDAVTDVRKAIERQESALAARIDQLQNTLQTSAARDARFFFDGYTTFQKAGESLTQPAGKEAAALEEQPRVAGEAPANSPRLLQGIADPNEQLRHFVSALAAKDAEIEGRASALAAREDENRRLLATLADKNTEIQRAAAAGTDRDHDIAALTSALSASDLQGAQDAAQIDELARLFAEKDAGLAQLSTAAARLLRQKVGAEDALSELSASISRMLSFANARNGDPHEDAPRTLKEATRILNSRTALLSRFATLFLGKIRRRRSTR